MPNDIKASLFHISYTIKALLFYNKCLISTYLVKVYESTLTFKN